MIEPTINQRQMTNFAVNVSADLFANSAAPTSVDTTELENEINLMQKASYAEYKEKNDEIYRPQLTPPGIQTDDGSSIEEIFKQFDAANQTITIEQLKLFLESIKEMVDKRWMTFDNELTNLINAQARIESALATLQELKANPATPPAVFDAARREAENAFKHITQTMERVNASIVALPPSADARRLQKLMDVKPLIGFLDQILIKMQRAREEYMLTVPDREFALYEQLQKAMQDCLKAAAEKLKATQDQQAILFEFIKWFTLVATSALSFASGGSLSFLVGIASAAFIAVDFAAEGVISENIIEPVMAKTLAPMIEKMITWTKDLLVKANVPEDVAVALSAVVTMVAVALVTYGAGKALMGAAGYLAEREAVKAVMAVVQAFLKELLQSFKSAFPNLAKVPGLVAEFDELIIKTLAGTMENYLHRVSQLQLGVLGVSSGTEVAIQIATGFIEMYTKEFEAIISTLNSRDEIVTAQYKRAEERVIAHIHDKNKYVEMQSELQDSYRNALMKSIRAV